MKIALTSDKAGFLLKEKVKEHLISKGHEVTDVGQQSLEDEVLPFFVASDRGVELIKNGKAERGIFICGTGAGMCINANKHQGIYAIVSESIYSATLCRVINNANVLTFGSRIIGPEMAFEMCDAFLKTNFTEGMEADRAAYLEKLMSGYMEHLK